MSERFELKLSSLPKEHHPDDYVLSYDKSAKPIPPKDDFIISRNIDGSVLSIFMDDIWDISVYNTTSSKCRLNFIINKTEKLSDDYIHQMKWLMVCLMYLNPVVLSASSMILFLKSIRDLAVYCYENNIPYIYDLFADYKILKKYFSDANPSVKNIISTLQIMSHLSKMDRNVTGVIITNDMRLNEISAQAQNARIEQLAQTLPIPSRLYFLRIEQLSNLINDFSVHKNGLILFLRKLLNEPHYGLSKLKQKILGRGDTQRKSKLTGKKCLPCLATFDEALEEHGLTMFAQKYGFNSKQSFSGFLTKVRYVCKHQIHLYSGMRHDEVRLLKYGCLHRESMSWGESYFISGITTKMSQSRKLVRWVTCIEVKKAIELAEAITEEVAKRFGYKSTDCSLFIPHSIISSKRYIPLQDDCIKFEMKDKYQPASFRIEQSDMVEIDRILLNVDWSKYPKLKVGEEWPYSFHQYRRSLAIYASNSGLIELSSLKYQLKHITDSMTMYYKKGSERATVVVGECPTDHFIHEFQDRKPISDAIVYFQNYLMSEEKLFGGQGKILERLRTDKEKNFILEERELTERRFKRGEIAFKETPLGACTSVDKCDSRLNISFTSCISCASAVLKPSKVDNFIRQLENSLLTLPPESVEYRLEKEQLDELNRLKNTMSLR